MVLTLPCRQALGSLVGSVFDDNFYREAWLLYLGELALE